MAEQNQIATESYVMELLCPKNQKTMSDKKEEIKGLTKEQQENWNDAAEKYKTCLLVGVRNGGLDATVFGDRDSLGKMLISFFVEAPNMRALIGDVLETMDKLDRVTAKATKPVKQKDIN